MASKLGMTVDLWMACSFWWLWYWCKVIVGRQRQQISVQLSRQVSKRKPLDVLQRKWPWLSKRLYGLTTCLSLPNWHWFSEDVSLVEFVYVVFNACQVELSQATRVSVVVGLRWMSCVTSIVRAQLLPIVCWFDTDSFHTEEWCPAVSDSPTIQHGPIFASLFNDTTKQN